MEALNIKILVATHKPYWMPTDGMYLPLHVGRQGKPGFGLQGDNTGDNISVKNSHYCELTGVFWAWKNLDADYIGLVHYRRHFTLSRHTWRQESKQKAVLKSQQAIKFLGTGKIILPKRRKYYIESNYSHYVHAHHAEGLKLTRAILSRDHPDYLPAFDRVMARRWAHLFNMFVMDRKTFDNYCLWLFSVLAAVENKLDLTGYSRYESRVFGYLGEYLLDIYLETHHIDYVEIPAMYMERRNWVLKASQFLKRKFFNTGSR